MPVHIVARLGVNSNDLSLLENSSVLEFEGLGIVTVLSEECDSFLIKPVKPKVGEPIDRDVRIFMGEVLNVDRPRVMVTLNRID